MAKESQSVLLNRIYLDPENPRHEALSDEPAIIKHLLAKEKVRALAKDIAEAGGTSPIELIALIKHPKINNAHLVVEGNRRVCALKLLQDPDKAGLEKDARYFAGLAQSMRSAINNVPAIVFDDREEARRWFALRHEGEKNGVGTKAWDSQQKARFSLRNQGKNPNAQAALVIDYARKHALLSAQEIGELSITTITRYLSNPVMRHALGLADSSSLNILVPHEEFDRALTRLLSDSRSPETSGVSSRTSAAERQAYASRLTQEGVAAISFGGPAHTPRSVPAPTTTPAVAATHGQASTPTAEAAQQDGAKAEAPASGTRDNRNPDKRTYVIHPGFSVKIQDKTLKRLYDELKKLDASVHSFAATYLLRTVVEKAISLCLASRGIEPKQKLHDKFKQLNIMLAADGMGDRELKFLRTVSMNGADDSYSPDSMGHYIHGGAIPPVNYAFRYWDNIEPIMRRVLKGI